MDKEIIRKGMIISKTVLFRFLLIQAGGFLRKPSRLFALIDRATKRISSYQGISDFGQDAEQGIKQLSRLALAYTRGEYKGLSRKQVVLIIGTILYFLTPFDIIPDAIPFLGLLDDLSLIAWLLATIKTELDAFLAWETQAENVSQSET